MDGNNERNSSHVAVFWHGATESQSLHLLLSCGLGLIGII